MHKECIIVLPEKTNLVLGFRADETGLIAGYLFVWPRDAERTLAGLDLYIALFIYCMMRSRMVQSALPRDQVS